jgi:hypothetical protein
MIRKGLVVDANQDMAWVLINDGEVVPTKQRRPPLEVGDWIELTPAKPAPYPWMRVAAVLTAACLIFLLLVPFQVYQPVITAVYLDSYPSVKMVVRKDWNDWIVVESVGQTAVSNTLLKTMKKQEEPLETFLVSYIKHAKKQGVLKKSEPLFLSTIVQANINLESVKKKINKQLKKPVQTLLVPERIVKRADQMGLTPAKFVAYKEATWSGKHYSSKQIVEEPLSKLMVEIPLAKQTLANPPKTENEWEAWMLYRDAIEEEPLNGLHDEETDNLLATPAQEDQEVSDTTEEPTEEKPQVETQAIQPSTKKGKTKRKPKPSSPPTPQQPKETNGIEPSPPPTQKPGELEPSPPPTQKPDEQTKPNEPNQPNIKEPTDEPTTDPTEPATQEPVTNPTEPTSTQ